MREALKKKPFYLSDIQCDWVFQTLERLTLREKVGQLICCVSPGESNEELLLRYQTIPYGGVTFRTAPARTIKERVDFLQRQVDIPLLVSANLENGGSGVAVASLRSQPPAIRPTPRCWGKSAVRKAPQWG